ANLVKPLSTLLSNQLNSIVYSPMVVLALGLDEKNIEHPLDGIGCLVPAVERNHLLGSLWSSSLFAERAPDGKALITCYMGGMVDKGALECSDEELVNRAMQDLKGLIGASGEPEFVRVIRHAKGLPQYHLGHQRRLQVIDGQLRLLPGLQLAGNYLDGVSVRDCIARGKTMADRIIGELPDVSGLKLIEGRGERESSDDQEAAFSTVGSVARRR
ncbi:MAG: protoporphyrinogen oxidase, partial [Mariprofundaceae bacterium]